MSLRKVRADLAYIVTHTAPNWLIHMRAREALAELQAPGDFSVLYYVAVAALLGYTFVGDEVGIGAVLPWLLITAREVYLIYPTKEERELQNGRRIESED